MKLFGVIFSDLTKLRQKTLYNHFHRLSAPCEDYISFDFVKSDRPLNEASRIHRDQMC